MSDDENTARLLDVTAPQNLRVQSLAILVIEGLSGSEPEILLAADVLDRLAQQGVSLAEVAAAMRADVYIEDEFLAYEQ